MSKIFNQEDQSVDGVVLTKLEAKALLHMLRRIDITEPCFTRFAVELAEKLMGEGIR